MTYWIIAKCSNILKISFIRKISRVFYYSFSCPIYTYIISIHLEVLWCQTLSRLCVVVLTLTFYTFINNYSTRCRCSVILTFYIFYTYRCYYAQYTYSSIQYNYQRRLFLKSCTYLFILKDYYFLLYTAYTSFQA